MFLEPIYKYRRQMNGFSMESVFVPDDFGSFFGELPDSVSAFAVQRPHSRLLIDLNDGDSYPAVLGAAAYIELNGAENFIVTPSGCGLPKGEACTNSGIVRDYRSPFALIYEDELFPDGEERLLDLYGAGNMLIICGEHAGGLIARSLLETPREYSVMLAADFSKMSVTTKKHLCADLDFRISDVKFPRFSAEYYSELLTLLLLDNGISADGSFTEALHRISVVSGKSLGGFEIFDCVSRALSRGLCAFGEAELYSYALPDKRVNVHGKRRRSNTASELCGIFAHKAKERGFTLEDACRSAVTDCLTTLQKPSAADVEVLFERTVQALALRWYSDRSTDMDLITEADVLAAVGELLSERGRDNG